MNLRRRSRRIRLALVCFALATTAGCSFIFSKGPPLGHEQMDYFTCTESNTAPILDIVWGGLNVLTALTVAADPDAFEAEWGYDAGTAMAIYFGWGVVSSVSAATGFGKSKKCREAKMQLAQRQAQYRSGAVPPASTEATFVQTVVLSPQSDTLAVGATLQLVATAYHSSGVTIPNRTFTWSSSNDAVASVTNAGLVTAYAPGSAVIAANTGNVVGVARLMIIAAP